MNMVKIAALTSLMVASSAFAQWPAGTPEERRGSKPSNMGNPTPQETLETERDHKGRLVTEDGLPVETMREENDPAPAPDRHSSPGGPTDPGSDPGTLE
ncbi:hypothetical protein [Pseudomonas saudiphocaensis]|uniref:hypothetical protein n=1 Tax=Pseudomonas saudiphocaensis TaxID=1499686 RepID=UPI000F79ED68|nr:hypothetical protein [Pseudomonas saudiphocaensis]RRV17046.1 hypothetical protein EGJ00_06240 [Pseudomonas saudiphocaensis]